MRAALAAEEAFPRAALSGGALVRAAQEFARIAREVSDCGSAQNAGDLGAFGRGAMQAPFEAAAFGLQVGAMSGIVDTDSGVHLVLRTA